MNEVSFDFEASIWKGLSQDDARNHRDHSKFEQTKHDRSNMRQGPYELLILNGDSEPYQEKELLGQPCIRAEPEREYHVLINVYRDAKGHFPAKYLRFGLFVDGVDVQYWKRIDLSDEDKLPKDQSIPVCSRFWGFKKNVNEIRSFVFSTPDTTSNSSNNSVIDYKSLGSVKLVVYEASVTTGIYENQSGQFEPPTAQQIGENGKFWQQASLTTTAGKKIQLASEKFLSLPRWSNLRKVPDAELMIHYHTSSMVDFLEEHQHTIAHEVGISSSSYSGGNNTISTSSSGVVYDLTSDGDETDNETRNITKSINQGGNSNSISNFTESRKRGRETKDSGEEDSDLDSACISAQQVASRNATSPTEFPIDEDISIVVLKKTAPFLDLSDEQVENSGEACIEAVWSTITN